MRKLGLFHLALLVCLLVVVFNTSKIAARKDGLLKVYFLNVGQGDAILIESPNGNQVLIDGGPDARVLSELGDVMSFYDREIDMVVLTHAHADHVAGLIPVLERFEVVSVVETFASYESGDFKAWQDAVLAEGAQHFEAVAGKIFDLGNETTLTVLYPFESLNGIEKNPNDISVTLLLDYKNTEILLTGDLEEKGERKLIISGISVDADVIKLGHHGSKTSSSESFLAATSPQTAIISAGLNNSYGHPHPDVTRRLENFSIPYYRTDTQGRVTLLSDGEFYSLITEK